jgi:hypothetical protein
MRQPGGLGGTPLDGAGQMLSVGDRATLGYVDRLYLYELPVERQDPYEAQLDKIVTITEVDDCGDVAIRFEDSAGIVQVYWIEPRWLRRLPI